MRFWFIAGVVGIALVASVLYLRTRPTAPSASTASRESAVGCRSVHRDYALHESNIWVILRATVERLLPDSVGRYRHQRFVVRCPGGQTVLIVNDVTIGERVPVAVGAIVGVRGQYVWNSRGGLVHFTHHGDAGGPGGWILWRSHVFSLSRSEWTILRTKTWITE